MKYIHHQQKHLFALIAVVFLCSCAPENHANEPEASISPPQLISCASEATCDRDPEHLKEFLVSFYNWYNKSEDDLSRLPSRQSEMERAVFQQTVARYFVPDFFTRKMYESDDPGDNDFDPILCAQDLYLQKDTNPSIRSLAIQYDRAFFAVSIDFSDDPSGEEFLPDLTRVVILKPQAEHWVIDMISCPG